MSSFPTLAGRDSIRFSRWNLRSSVSTLEAYKVSRFDAPIDLRHRYSLRYICGPGDGGKTNLCSAGGPKLITTRVLGARGKRSLQRGDYSQGSGGSQKQLTPGSANYRTDEALCACDSLLGTTSLLKYRRFDPITPHRS